MMRACKLAFYPEREASRGGDASERMYIAVFQYLASFPALG